MISLDAALEPKVDTQITYHVQAVIKASNCLPTVILSS